MRIAPVSARPVGNRSIQIRSSVFGVDDTRTELLPLPELELELLPEELVLPELTPLTVTFRVLLATVQPL